MYGRVPECLGSYMFVSVWISMGVSLVVDVSITGVFTDKCLRYSYLVLEFGVVTLLNR